MGRVAVRDMRFLRRKPRVNEVFKAGRGHLTDRSGNHDIQLDWNLNAQAQKDKVFKMTIGDKEVYIDLEELTFYTRAMFK